MHLFLFDRRLLLFMTVFISPPPPCLFLYYGVIAKFMIGQLSFDACLIDAMLLVCNWAAVVHQNVMIFYKEMKASERSQNPGLLPRTRNAKCGQTAATGEGAMIVTHAKQVT